MPSTSSASAFVGTIASTSRATRSDCLRFPASSSFFASAMTASHASANACFVSGFDRSSVCASKSGFNDARPCPFAGAARSDRDAPYRRRAESVCRQSCGPAASRRVARSTRNGGAPSGHALRRRARRHRRLEPPLDRLRVPPERRLEAEGAAAPERDEARPLLHAFAAPTEPNRHVGSEARSRGRPHAPRERDQGSSSAGTWRSGVSATPRWWP